VLRRCAAVAAAVLIGMTAGCSGSSPAPGQPPSSGLAPGPPDQAASSGPAGQAGKLDLSGLRGVHSCLGAPGYSCGTLSVPVDPAGSAPGRLALQVGVSDVTAAPRGVLVLLTGGPGQPGVPFLNRLASRLGPALNGYRLVMFDQRGTGAAALDCPALQQQMGGSDLARPTTAAVTDCAGRIGPSRRFFATADTVADIEALRRALDVSRLALDGVSYGTYVAERYALAYPDRVSRMVLDSVVPSWNADPLQLATMRRTATVLRALCAVQHCGFDPADDLAADVRRYHDGPALLDAVVAMSVGAPAFPGLLASLHAAASGRPAMLTSLIAQVHSGDAATAPELSQGLHASTLCADLLMPWGGPDTPQAARQAALTRVISRLTPAQTWPFDRATAQDNGFIQTCLYWPPTAVTPGPGPASARPDLPRVPVLLLAGTYDLSTPMADDLAQAERAPDGRLVTFPGAGHSVQSRAAGDPAVPVLERFLGS
jgi:pimeloyl-ACP methyl ester carboxylesterase